MKLVQKGNSSDDNSRRPAPLSARYQLQVQLPQQPFYFLLTHYGSA